ncbi:FecR family protein [Salinimicrobium sediminilitoris]|uniref:FecR family protein n=1 Tax=Salinimicrobium sediminilitoris TaxID=2876715 RepID=UPI001E55B402|nr:FecR family protein [Salinimicrobium sediminilitoris]MCC8360618.1 FecR family protein [Salinimicrobium sediminilitoris]
MEFQTLLKKLDNKLNAAEEREFQEWFEASQKHQDYYQRVKIEFQKEHYQTPSTNKAWKKMDRRLFATKRRNYRWAMAAAAILVVLLSIPFFTADFISTEVEVTSTPSAEEQGKGVLLIDESGRQQLMSEGAAITSGYYNANSQSLIIKEPDASDKEKNVSEEIKMNTVVVPRGIQFSVVMADGSKVWLNSDTKISFPSSFKGLKSRFVRIEYGEAYFEITSSKQNNGQKFIVQNREQEIEVLGTKFNVNAYPDKESLATTLVEGSVKISSGRRSLKLKPGQQSLVSNENFEVQHVNVWKYISWTQGKYVFNNESLDEIMQVVGRWYDVEVNFEQPAMRDLRFNGVLNKNQQLEELLEIFKNTNKANFELNGSSIKVMGKN